MPNSFRPEMLKQRREILEMSRLDVVKRLYERKLDTTEETLRMWEEGQTSPDADWLPALADILKCKVQEFYG